MTNLSSNSPTLNSSRFTWSDLITRLGPLIGLIFVLILFSILEPQKFLRLNNFELILRQTAVVGTAALGMTLVIISGGIDLSVGSAIALHTVVIALLLRCGVFPFGSAIGGIRETQEMLDFCAERGITSDVELIRIQQINDAFARLLKSDVKYRFVIDMDSLRK